MNWHINTHIHHNTHVYTAILSRNTHAIAYILDALRFTAELVLPELATRQTRRGRQSNAYRMFGRRWSSDNGPRDLAHPSPIFYRGLKVRIWASFLTSLNLRPRCLKMQQGISTLKQTRWAEMMSVCPLQVWWCSVHAPLRSFRGNATPSKISRR